MLPSFYLFDRACPTVVEQTVAIPLSERGVSAVEFAITLPTLLLALLGTFQGALLYQARAQFEVATQEAVRAGTLHGANTEAIREALARGLTPLYSHGQNLEALARGYAAAKTAAAQANIQILSPTREAFDDFAELTRDGSGAPVHAIPVDHLAYRQTRAGVNSKMSIQDATLLKVQITTVQPLVIPFIDQIGRGLYALKQEMGLPSIFGLQLSPVTGINGQMGWGIPLQTDTVMRMQSPVLVAGLPSQNQLVQHPEAESVHGSTPPASNMEPLPTSPSDLATISDDKAPVSDNICNAGA